MPLSRSNPSATSRGVASPMLIATELQDAWRCAVCPIAASAADEFSRGGREWFLASMGQRNEARPPNVAAMWLQPPSGGGCEQTCARRQHVRQGCGSSAQLRSGCRYDMPLRLAWPFFITAIGLRVETVGLRVCMYVCMRRRARLSMRERVYACVFDVVVTG